jgi:hypothetical protein
VIVTLLGLRFGTLEETSEATPRMAAGSSVAESALRSTAAVAGCFSSAKRSSLGSVSWTWALEMPSICPMVCEIWPSSAR